MRDGTGTIELRFLSEDVDRHGNVRVYFRRYGRKVRIRPVPGTDAFMAEYRDLLHVLPEQPARSTGPARGTLLWLCMRYFDSAAFRGLGSGTRRVRRGILEGICGATLPERQAVNGGLPYALMEPRHVAKIRDQKADLPESANGRVKALRQLFRWACSVEQGLAARNPAMDVAYLAPANPGGFHTWTEPEVAQFEARHPIGTKARLAMALLLYTGVRRSDVVRLGRQMERRGWLYFTETKGRAKGEKNREIPILPELRTVLDATPSGHLTYLVTEFGKPFTMNGFGNWLRRRCNEAGLPRCSAHGLRKAGATIAANRGATEYQLMAIYGWDTAKEAARYTRKANRRRLAGEAMHLVVPEPESGSTVPPPEGVNCPTEITN